MIGRLVQQQQIRRSEQHLRESQPSLLATAQGNDCLIERNLIKAKMLQYVIAQRLIGITAECLQSIERGLIFSQAYWIERRGQRQAFDLGGSLHARIVQRVGQRTPDRICQTLAQVAHPRMRIDEHAAPIGLFFSRDDAQQRRLAAAVRTQQAYALAGTDHKRNVFEDELIRKGFCEVID